MASTIYGLLQIRQPAAESKKELRDEWCCCRGTEARCWTPQASDTRIMDRSSQFSQGPRMNDSKSASA